MRRYRLVLTVAAALAATTAHEARAQMFRKGRERAAKATAPQAPPPAGPSAPGGRSVHNLIRNGFDYLDRYEDPARALAYFQEAIKYEHELTADEVSRLRDGLARASKLKAEYVAVPRLPRKPKTGLALPAESLASQRRSADMEPSVFEGAAAPKTDQQIQVTGSRDPKPPAMETTPLEAPVQAESTLAAEPPTERPAVAVPDLEVGLASEPPTAPQARRRVDADLPPAPTAPVSNPQPEPEPLGLTIISDAGGATPAATNDLPAPPVSAAADVVSDPVPPASEPVVPRRTSLPTREPQRLLDVRMGGVDVPQLPYEPTATATPAATRLTDPPTNADRPEPPPLNLTPMTLPELPPAGTPPTPELPNVASDAAFLAAPPADATPAQGSPSVPDEVTASPAPSVNTGRDPEPAVPELIAVDPRRPLVEESTAAPAVEANPVPAAATAPPTMDLPELPTATVTTGATELPLDRATLEAQPISRPSAENPAMILPEPPPALPRPALDEGLPPLPTDAASETVAPPADELADPRSAARPARELVSLRPNAIQLHDAETQREIERIAQRQDDDLRANPRPRALSESHADMGDSDAAPLPRAPSPTEARPINPIPVPEEYVPFEKRQFEPYRKYWAAAATCHAPLYFQDAVLERYGQSAEQALGPHWGRRLSYPLDDPTQTSQRNQILQPAYSAGLFIVQMATWPVNAVLNPPWEAEYDLGYYRPGDPIPPDSYYWPKLGVGPPLRGMKY